MALFEHEQEGAAIGIQGPALAVIGPTHKSRLASLIA